MSNSQYLADLHEIRKAYVQDVKENYPNKILSKSEANVNGNNIINENNFNLTNPNIDSMELSDEVEFWGGLNDGGNEGVAIVEFDSFIDSEFIGTEFGDTNYHTVVTIFEPDTERGGMPFDYIEELLLNPDNYELEIVRRQPARSATQEKHPNTSSELPSNFSIFNTNKNVKQDNKSQKSQEETRQITQGDGSLC